MLAPRNLGPDYARAFDGIYPELAAQARADPLSLLPRRRGAGRKAQPDDGLHPNSKGVAEITKKILPSVEQLIERVRAKQAAATKG